MTAALSAIESAGYAVLSAPGAVSAAVYQHAPKDSAYPIVILGDFDDIVPIGRASDPDRRMTMGIVALTEGEERAPCAALVEEIMQALDGAIVSQSGWTIEFSFQQSSVNLAEDGLGYVGLVQFQVLALG